MTKFKIHAPDSAPEASRLLLKQIEDGFGFVPNLFGALAESRATLEGYLKLDATFRDSSLSRVEQQVVILTASFENGCEYCMSAHTATAKEAKVTGDVLAALRGGGELPNERLNALRTFTRTVVRERGWASEQDLQSFLDAGFTRGQVLEVILGVALKTLSNYANHVVHPPLDAAFEESAWQRPKEVGTR